MSTAPDPACSSSRYCARAAGSSLAGSRPGLEAPGELAEVTEVTEPAESTGLAGAASTGPFEPVVATDSSGDPTGSSWPGSPYSWCTLPACGQGRSTVALAVSTVTTTWSTTTSSPTATCHSMTSASVRPSPRSGSRNTAGDTVVATLMRHLR